MRSACVILLLLSACDRPPSREAAAIAPEQAAAPNALAPAAEPAETAALRTRAERALAAALPGAKVQLRGLRTGVLNTVCGEVATGGSAEAGFRPFIVRRDGSVGVAPKPRIAYDDPGDMFAGEWIDYCATLDELRRIAPPSDAVSNPQVAMPVFVEEPEPTVEEIQAEAERILSGGAEPTAEESGRVGPTPTIDSFEKSVRKN